MIPARPKVRRPSLAFRIGTGRPFARSLLVVLLAVISIFATGCGTPDILPDGGPETTAVTPPDPAPGQGYLFALIGNDDRYLARERRAGIEAKVLALSWRDFYLAEGRVDARYVERKRDQLQDLRGRGFRVIASLNLHDTPSWVHENYENTYYVNQFGDRWTGTNVYKGQLRDNGDANLVFNGRLRALAESYTEEVFSRLGTGFWAVRIGGGRFGEITYPPPEFAGNGNLYWAYDENARRGAAEAEAGGWRPGDPSPDGQAARFLNWYLDSLVEFQGWQVRTVREAGYQGKVMVLYPGWGVRPGEVREAVAGNLDGSSPGEANGELPRGRDFARQVAAIRDEKVLVTTTALDAPPEADDGQNPRDWSPVRYLYSLAESNPSDPGIYGENSGGGSLEAMLISAHQMRRYGLEGMAWYDEEQLFSGTHATLEDYERVIEEYDEGPVG